MPTVFWIQLQKKYSSHYHVPDVDTYLGPSKATMGETPRNAANNFLRLVALQIGSTNHSLRSKYSSGKSSRENIFDYG